MQKGERIETAALRLLDDLANRFAGESASYRSYSRYDKSRPEYRHYLVPSTFIGRINGYDTTIQVHRRRLKPGQCSLLVKVHVPSNIDISIKHEHIDKKVSRFFGLSDEFQTGDKYFDDSYLLRIGSRVDQMLLKDPDFRETVCKLEPFRFLNINCNEIAICRNMTSVADLEFIQIEPILTSLGDIARRICKS